jgi:hypothetical protein
MYRKLPPSVVEGLRGKEGRWPEYPQALHAAARDQNMVIPDMSLPGPRELWENAVAYLPEVPDQTLRRFALLELTPEERAKLKLSATDPASRDRLRQKYFEHNPDELRKRRLEKP